MSRNDELGSAHHAGNARDASPIPQRPWTVPDRIALAILILMLAVAAVLIAAANIAPHPAATGTPHPTFPSMQHGGPGQARVEGLLGLGWAFGALPLLFFALCFALGLRRSGGLGPLRVPLVAGAALHQLCWLWLLHSYSIYSADPTSHTTVLGFPPATAIMLYVLWPFPAWFVALYVLNFDRCVFSADDQRRFDEVVAEYRASSGADDGFD